MPPPLVLVADNDHAVSALLTQVLERNGCTVTQAFDGEQAKAKAVDPAVRVVVCDLDMPRVAGIEVLEWLSRQPQPPAAVVVSGYVDGAVVERLRALPCVRSVQRKPFDLAAFASLVRRLADHAEAAAVPAPSDAVAGTE